MIQRFTSILIFLGATSSFAMEKEFEIELARNLASIEEITSYDCPFKTRLKQEDVLKRDLHEANQQKIKLAEEKISEQERNKNCTFGGIKYHATERGLEITDKNGETKVKSFEDGIICSGNPPCRRVKEVLVTSTAIYALTCCTLCISHDGGDYFQVSIVGKPTCSSGWYAGEPIKDLRIEDDHLMASGWGPGLKQVPCDLGTEDEIQESLERGWDKSYKEFLPMVQCEKKLW